MHSRVQCSILSVLLASSLSPLRAKGSNNNDNGQQHSTVVSNTYTATTVMMVNRRQSASATYILCPQFPYTYTLCPFPISSGLFLQKSSSYHILVRLPYPLCSMLGNQTNFPISTHFSSSFFFILTLPLLPPPPHLHQTFPPSLSSQPVRENFSFLFAAKMA